MTPTCCPPDDKFLLIYSTNFAVCGQTWFIFLTPPIFISAHFNFSYISKNPNNLNGSKEPPRVTQSSYDTFLVAMEKMSMSL